MYWDTPEYSDVKPCKECRRYKKMKSIGIDHCSKHTGTQPNYTCADWEPKEETKKI